MPDDPIRIEILWQMVIDVLRSARLLQEGKCKVDAPVF